MTTDQMQIQTQPREVVRLTQAMYDNLEKQLPGPAVNADSSPQQVGYLLGVQRVLQLLRTGWVTK